MSVIIELLLSSLVVTIIHIFDLKPYQKYYFCDIIKDSLEDEENKFNVSCHKFTIFGFANSATKCSQESLA